MTNKDLLQEAEELIINGRIDKALKLLLKFCRDSSSDNYNDVASLSSQFNTTIRKERLGLGEFGTEINRMTQAILTIITDEKKQLKENLGSLDNPYQDLKSREKFNEPIMDIFRDTRDRQDYKIIKLLDNNWWFADNLRFRIEDSWSYDDKEENGLMYGRLYTWEAAKKACPPGWHIPSDKEWRNVANLYGGIRSWEDGKYVEYGDPQKTFKDLLEEGNSGFSAQLSGYRSSNGNFTSLGKSGYYWSNSECEGSSAWYYKFNGSNAKLYRYCDYKSYPLSARCVQD